MMRLFVLALVLINAAYFIWSQGKLPGLAPEQQTEPQRMAQQLKPTAVRLLTAQQARQLEAPPVAARPAECLQSGLLSDAQGEQLRPLLASTWPADAWTLTPVLEPARWIVYLGKFASPAAMAKKRSDLASLNLKFAPLQNPALQPGLAVGVYETQAAATTALGALSRRGLRNARVLQERAEVRGMMLRLPSVDDALRPRLSVLKPALGDSALLTCK